MPIFYYLMRDVFHFSQKKIVILTMCLLSVFGCDTPDVFLNKELVGANHLAFRCLDKNGQGISLNRCGCIQSQLNDNGSRFLNVLQGDECKEAQQNTELLLYFASSVDSQVALINMSDNQRRVVNLSSTIPEVTFIKSDGLISDLLVHPYGDFAMMVLGMESRIQLLKDPFTFLPELSLDLDIGPIADAVVWPRPDIEIPSDTAASFLYVLTAVDGKILEIDLDMISLGLSRVLEGQEGGNGMTNEAGQDIMQQAVVRSWQVVDEDGSPISLARLDVDPSHQYIVATHQLESKVSIIDLQNTEEMTDTSVRREVSFDFASDCKDAYLTHVLSMTQKQSTCQDGLDNNADGFVDQDDPMCQSYKVEAIDIHCPQQSQCTDGVDNDQDDLIDEQDPDCDINTFDVSTCSDDEQRCLRRFIFWEGQAAQCDDGVDNDGDGLIDRFDPGCYTQEDQTESSDTREVSTCLDGIDNDQDQKIDLEDEDCVLQNSRKQRLFYQTEGDLNGAEDPCLDGVDNDSDGLIDQEDPGCFDANATRLYRNEFIARCADGIDNDYDGLIDYQDAGLGDPDCSFAADNNEGSSLVSVSSHLLLTNSLETINGTRSFAYINASNGDLLAIDLDPNAKQQIYTAASGLFVQSATIRQQGNLANLWVIDKSLSLHSINITAPKALLVNDKQAVYALKSEEDQAASTLTGTASNTFNIKAFYLIHQGQAFHLDMLDQWLAEITYDQTTERYLLPSEAQDVIKQITIEDLTALNLDPTTKGFNDLQVFINTNSYPLWMQPWNRYRDALGQTTRVVDNISLLVGGLNSELDVEYFPSFCRLSNEEDDCILIGYNEFGQVEDEEEKRARSASYIDQYEGIQVVAERPVEVEEGTYKLAYEDVLPGTNSNSGYMMSSNDDFWIMIDYGKNFCNLGIEAGDIIVVEKFYPYDNQTASKEACLPYLNRNPDEGILPLRYKIESVSSHRLVLVQDDRIGYENQVAPSKTGDIPRLAIPLPPPPYECASQEISYYIQIGAGQWILSNNGKYRHYWRSVAGQCEKDVQAELEKRDFRIRPREDDPQQGLNQTFENEWFKFRLGYQSAEDMQRGVVEGALPYMVGIYYEFYVAKGYKSNFYDFVSRSPQNMMWLPERDRLYITDAAAQEITAYSNVTPYMDFVTFADYFR